MGPFQGLQVNQSKKTESDSHKEIPSVSMSLGFHLGSLLVPMTPSDTDILLSWAALRWRDRERGASLPASLP